MAASRSPSSAKKKRSAPTRKRSSAAARPAARKKAAGRSQKPVRKHRSTSGFWRWFWLVLFCLGLFLAWQILKLDYRVRTEFHAPVNSALTRLYSRPLQLQSGVVRSEKQLAAALDARGYRAVTTLSAAGQYVKARGVMDIWQKAGSAWNNFTKPLAVRVHFSHGRVEKILNHQSGQPLTTLSFAPVLLGNMQTGPAKDRLPLKLHEAPDFLLATLLTMEDRRFYQHHGVDPRSLVRAVFNVLRGHRAQATSTLTQQLVKNIYLTPERKLTRKLKEMGMALLVELHFSKAEILERYLNEVFLGQSGHRAIHGFKLAAQFYFGRDLADLNQGDIAMLVGLIPAPSAYNPHRHPERAKKRRDLVLNTLLAQGELSVRDAARYQGDELRTRRSEKNRKRYHDFIDLIDQQLAQDYESVYLNTQGLSLYTTLDPLVQDAAETALGKTLGALEKSHGLAADTLEGAAVVVQPQSGEVLAVVGSRYPRRAGFNRALDAHRPIGSLVKPAVYLTALSQPDRYSLASQLDDSPISVPQDNKPDWQPRNYDGQSHPEPMLINALANSYNIATVRLGLDIGLPVVQAALQRLGQADLPNYPSLLLGAYNASPYDMAQMYQPLANGGKFLPLRSLAAISDQDDTLIVRFDEQGQQVTDPVANYLLDTALRETVRSGTASALSTLLPGKAFAGKTGTTDDYRDSWFAGYANGLLAVVWVGNDNNQPIRLSGAAGALRVWAGLMQRLNAPSLPPPSPPAGVVTINTDLDNGELAVAGCSQRSAVLPFVRGYQPTANSRCPALQNRLRNWLQRWLESPGASIRQTPENQPAPRRKPVPVENIFLDHDSDR